MKILNGWKTLLLVLVLIGITLHMIYTGLLKGEWGMMFIVTSLIPLAMNNRKERLHKELMTKIDRMTPADVGGGKVQKTQWD